MGLFNFRRKPSEPKQPPHNPYRESSLNFIYNLLFCDDITLFKKSGEPPHPYPFDILFSETSSIADLQKIIDDTDTDPRYRVLAYNKQLASGHTPARKELLAVIVEVGLDGGLDVLASFVDGTARYINHSEKLIAWEDREDPRMIELTDDLFTISRNIIDVLGPWDKPRRPHPPSGMTRLSFLVSDGLYFGEGQQTVSSMNHSLHLLWAVLRI